VDFPPVDAGTPAQGRLNAAPEQSTPECRKTESAMIGHACSEAAGFSLSDIINPAIKYRYRRHSGESRNPCA
jgi:hypothetical protein